MIGSLRGQLRSKQAPVVNVECNGVGYDVETPMSTFFMLPAVGGDVFLHTHLLVREDAQILYGFATEQERALFRSVLRVRGIGARIALAILSAMSVADFTRSIEHEDATALSRIPGIGKKTAERLIIEMRDRIDAGGTAPSGGPAPGQDPRGEAVDALVALGYKTAEINRLLAGLDIEGQSAEDIIRLALRQAVS